ncbi:hypothetical protein FACS1894106_5440 [Spirochaetia bacterium]|nr:hypothetical protein FACS1894106_5440 [Spirochaetia bacterium]
MADETAGLSAGLAWVCTAVSRAGEAGFGIVISGTAETAEDLGSSFDCGISSLKYLIFLSSAGEAENRVKI